MSGFKKAKIYGVNIIGKTAKSIKKAAEAVACLKKDESWAAKLKNLKTIAIHPKLDYDNELFFKEKLWVCQSGTVMESSSVYLASLLVHELFHIDQMKNGLTNDDFKLEPDAYKQQIKFLKENGADWDAKYVEKLLKEKHWENNYIKGKNDKKYISPFLRYLESIKKAEISELIL